MSNPGQSSSSTQPVKSEHTSHSTQTQSTEPPHVMHIDVLNEIISYLQLVYDTCGDRRKATIRWSAFEGMDELGDLLKVKGNTDKAREYIMNAATNQNRAFWSTPVPLADVVSDLLAELKADLETGETIIEGEHDREDVMARIEELRRSAEVMSKPPMAGFERG